MSDTLLTRFNFAAQIELSGRGGDEDLPHGEGAFSEITGLELTLEPTSFREGGYHAGPRQLIGKTTTTPLVFKRGVALDTAFWTWIQRCTAGPYPLPYVSGSIFVRSRDGTPAGQAVWRFVNGIVTKVKSADLSAVDPKDLPIEELHVVHEGLTRGPT